MNLRTPGLKESIRLGSTAILMQIGDLWKGGDEILKLFLKQECANFFKAAGYGAN